MVSWHGVIANVNLVDGYKFKKKQLTVCNIFQFDSIFQIVRFEYLRFLHLKVNI